MTSEGKTIDEKNFVKAKADRTNTRKIFTKIVKNLTEALHNGEMNDEILVQYENLTTKARHLQALDLTVKDWYLEQDMDLELEYEVADKYQNEFRLITRKYERVLKEGQSEAEMPASAVQSKRQFKLPQVELVKFDGEIKNWIPFWAQFSKIHFDDSIDNHDKFQYLVAAIPKGTTARELINSFPASSENYPIAIEHLKQRFGREDLLVNVYIRELLNLILSQANNKYALPLSSLYDQLTTQLRALETMGLTSDKFALLLFPLVESALPSETLKAWERSQAGIQARTGNNLNNILTFLKHEVESNQRVSLAHSTFGVRNNSQSIETHEEDITPTTSCFTTSDQKATKHIEHCIWCDKDSHTSSNCVKAVGLSLDDRKKHIKKVRGCSNCLKIGHNAFKCKAFIKCVACHKRHNVLFCPEINQINKNNKVVSKSDSGTHDSQLSISHFKNVTLLQTLLVKIVFNNKEVTVRALIDSGAQRSYIKRSVVQVLNLPVIAEEELGHIVFGGIETKKELHRLYNITITDLCKSIIFNMTVYDEERLCGYLPRVHEREILEQLHSHNIRLTDKGQSCLDIGLLIGADYCGLLLTNKVVQLNNRLTAVETILGWTLQGVKSMSDSSSALNSLVVSDINNLWELEHLGIRDPAETKSRKQIESETLVRFEKSVTVNREGRYEVCLPWKDIEFMDTSLSNNYDLAYKRLQSNTKRLLRYDIYQAYNEVFEEWLHLGIIEEVREDNRSGHYLCHHAIVKNSSLTTKIRPVFDASARDKSGRSLNSCLEKGVNLLELIPKLLIHFRLRTVGVTSDIEKAFLQISIKTDDRNFLKFLWWKDDSKTETKTFRHCRVVFGLTCSPFLLGATIRYHLCNPSIEMSTIAKRLLGAFYVDNCVTSLEPSDVNPFVKNAISLMKDGKFNLREWVISPMPGMSAGKQKTVSVLGVLWDTLTDTISCNIDLPSVNKNRITKRILLSVAQRVFDPIGITSPTSLIPKLLLQKACALKLKWDDILPVDISGEFEEWLSHLHLLKDYIIPRRLTASPLDQCQKSIHTFCDASKKSFGCCVFLRSEQNGHVAVRLIWAE